MVNLPLVQYVSILMKVITKYCHLKSHCEDILVYKLYTYIYTGCPRKNVPEFGRVFLMLNYTDITQNTYVQS